MKVRSFVFGTLFGTAITAITMVCFPHFWAHPHFPPNPAAEQHLMKERFAHELELTTDQKIRIEPLLEQFHLDLLKIKLSKKPELLMLANKFEEEILPLLDAVQRQKLLAIRQKILSHDDDEERFIEQNHK